jgi:hypothetical protein
VYSPPGGIHEIFSRIPADCQELPTGRYSVNVLHGIAGGAVTADPDTDTGFNIVGGSLSGQAWSVPNELGDPCQFSDDAECADGAGLAVPSQGPLGSFIVAEADACANATSAVGESRPDSNACDGDDAPRSCVTARSLLTGMTDDIAYKCPPPECCDPIRHLCDVPLCEVEELKGAEGVRVRPQAEDDDGDGVPNCLPFLMPFSCCNPDSCAEFEAVDPCAEAS